MKGNSSGKLVLMICILIGLLVVPACAENLCITRDVADFAYTGNSFEVTVNLDNLRAGGIIETIPSGMTFVSTTHPKERYEQQGQEIIFSVVEDDSISYTLRAGSTGTATIKGIWYDALTKQDGVIPDSSLSVHAYSSGGSDSSDDSAATISALVLNVEGKVSTPMQVKSNDQRAVLDIPVGVSAHDEKGQPISEVSIAGLRSLEVEELSGTDYLFENHVYRCSPAGATFDPAIDLSFTFTQEEWDSFPEDKSLRIQHYDPKKKEWTPLPTTIDEESRTICASTTHFSIFGVFTAKKAVNPTATIAKETASPTKHKPVTIADASNVPKEKADTPEHVTVFTAPDEADGKPNMNPLFFVAALIVVIIAISAVVVMKKNGKEKEE
ncbi:MAG: hypothetical protein GX097_01850 [Methanomicrobiales archaeon]|nr:hypothetical protein [Methanomicrobiales archaeon]